MLVSSTADAAPSFLPEYMAFHYSTAALYQVPGISVCARARDSTCWWLFIQQWLWPEASPSALLGTGYERCCFLEGFQYPTPPLPDTTRTRAGVHTV